MHSNPQAMHIDALPNEPMIEAVKSQAKGDLMESFPLDKGNLDSIRKGVGFVGETISRHIFNLPPLSFEKWEEHRDKKYRFDAVESDRLRLRIEMKIGSNVDPLKFFSDQLDGQLSRLLFPVPDGISTVLSYRNREKRAQAGKEFRKRLLPQHVGSEEMLVRFLQDNIREMYVVDIRLLDAIRQAYGTKRHAWDGDRERYVINVKRQDLRKLQTDARHELSTHLQLDPALTPRWLPPLGARIHSRWISTVWEGRPLHIEMIPFIPIAIRRRITRELNGTLSKTP